VPAGDLVQVLDPGDLAELSRAHTVVTDREPPAPLAEALQEAEVEVVVAT
jgi:DeoR/GlpR family transcriptional regulator of sugar metabolism